MFTGSLLHGSNYCYQRHHKDNFSFSVGRKLGSLQISFDFKGKYFNDKKVSRVGTSAIGLVQFSFECETHVESIVGGQNME